ncbi:MAG: carboxypeptidase regulatory-like domain-containing protein [Planctomycetota bacterium]|nr:MAG: carboxypeptidase regulatory-like domain-containing protein [Planctomycetota bacterium]
MMTQIGSKGVCLPALLVILVGCQGNDNLPETVEASGVVTLDGQPVEGAAIVFIDAEGKYTARGMSDKDGRFSLNAFEEKTGAVPGTYKVVVTKTVEQKTEGASIGGEEAEHAGEEANTMIVNLLPQKYSVPSGELTVTIPPEGTSDIKLELSSK